MLHPQNVEVRGSRALGLWIDAHHGLPLNAAAAATRYRRGEDGAPLSTICWLCPRHCVIGRCGCGGERLAHEAHGMSVQLTPSRDSGVSGTATLEDVEDGVEVTLEMRNLPKPAIKHINHIHAGGTCADDREGRTAPVTIPLETITAQEDGTGSATTTIEDLSVADLFGEDKERFVLLHAKTKKGEGVPPGISCADLDPLADTGGL